MTVHLQTQTTPQPNFVSFQVTVISHSKSFQLLSN